MNAVGMKRLAPTSGLLDYYLQHGLNPVHYDMANRTAHFQRRASLYRSLGLHPMTIRNSRVLEVAVGTGQNSLYLASLRPRHFTLVEPNPVAVKDIKALYARPENRAWQPELVESKLEDFQPAEAYDVVVCENWLGRVPAERALLRKLGSLVAPGGLLVVTTVAPVGFLPNVLRRLLAIRLGGWQRPFAECTGVMVEAFGTHLATIAAMTRGAVDWVHDTVMNPHYLNICLSIPTVAEDLGSSCTFVGSSPDFAVDWRWFKALAGDARDFNGHFLREYYSNCHNFLDYRQVRPAVAAEPNRVLEAAACRLVQTAIDIDLAAQTGQETADAGHGLVQCQLEDVITALQALPIALTKEIAALREFAQIYVLPTLTPAAVRGMPTFAGLFGRETVYVALEKGPS